MKNLNIQCKALATVNFVSEYEQMKPHESVRWAECRNTGQPGPGSTQQHFTCIRMENKLYQRHHTLSTVKNFAPKKRISQVSWTFNCKSMNYVVDILRKQSWICVQVTLLVVDAYWLLRGVQICCHSLDTDNCCSNTHYHEDTRSQQCNQPGPAQNTDEYIIFWCRLNSRHFMIQLHFLKNQFYISSTLLKAIKFWTIVTTFYLVQAAPSRF